MKILKASCTSMEGGCTYEKCPVCSMRLHGDGSNHKEFWENHVEDYEDEHCEDFYFDFDLERMKRAVESETVYLPERLKEKEEIMEWLLNYDTTQRS